MGTNREDDLRTAFAAIKEMDDPIDQAAFLDEYFEGKRKTPGSIALVDAVSRNLANEL